MYISTKLTKNIVRSLSYNSLEISKSNPHNFNGIHTIYGWFLIPKTHFAYRWTNQNISKAIETSFPDILENPRDIATLQQVVDKWVEGTDLSEKPKTVKLKKSDIRKQKEESLYRSQLREESYEEAAETETASSNVPKKIKKRAKSDAITFIHAWNYFCSITHSKYNHLGKKESRREISNEWNLLAIDEKDCYREAYAKLRAEGKDVYKGKIVTREEKLKKHRKKAKTE